MHSVTAVVSLLLAWADPSLSSADRPYGKVMGDGLGLRIETDPQAGGVCAPGETVFGIDVSYYQGTIDWNAVAADGVEYAIIRVSHSLQFFDPEFEANLAGARAAGIHAGTSSSSPARILSRKPISCSTRSGRCCPVICRR
jgi:hypothetical protein